MLKHNFSRLLLAAVVILLMAPALAISADSQIVTIAETTRIPETVLQPRKYVFSVEDRLKDRAIVRIASASGDQHHLLLAVPASEVPATHAGYLVFFPNRTGDTPAVKAWVCPGCRTALEFVYPKQEAIAITGQSAGPVLAVDPAYDKLPANLSADDRKVVTLWLLSPQRVTARHTGEGVKAVKYTSDVSPATPPLLAKAEPPAAASGRTRLPQTASINYLLIFSGSLLLSAALAFRLRRALLQAAER